MTLHVSTLTFVGLTKMQLVITLFEWNNKNQLIEGSFKMLYRTFFENKIYVVINILNYFSLSEMLKKYIFVHWTKWFLLWIINCNTFSVAPFMIYDNWLFQWWIKFGKPNLNWLETVKSVSHWKPRNNNFSTNVMTINLTWVELKRPQA